jgi:hypothetical protein
LGIDLHLYSISLVPVDGKAYVPLLRMLGANALRIPWVLLSDGENLTEIAGHLVSAAIETQAAVDTAKAVSRLREDILLAHDCFALDAGHDFEGALIYGGARADYETAISAHPEVGTLSAFVAGNASRATWSRERQVHEFMKHQSWGRKWKVVFAAHVADVITKGGQDASRIPTPIVAALRRVRDFATGAAVKA